MTALAATVRDNVTAHRYELLLDDEVVGELMYRKQGEVVTLIHTEIAARLEGRGLGEQLVAGVLDDIRGEGLHIVPLCPFVGAYLRRHPEYADLVESRQET
jgi:predicted GNAT family acetyltransferase